MKIKKSLKEQEHNVSKAIEDKEIIKQLDEAKHNLDKIKAVANGTYDPTKDKHSKSVVAALKSL